MPRGQPLTPTFEEATEGEEIERKERLKTKWAQLEAIVGSQNRVRQSRSGYRGPL